MQITIPPIRDREEAIDALGVILSKLSEDDAANVAYRILKGDYGNQSDAFVDQFHDAFNAVDAACAEWESRHDDADAPCGYDFNRHPDDPLYGSRLSFFGRAA